MAMGRPKSTVVLDSELREQLDSLAKSRSLPASLVRRAKIILLRPLGRTTERSPHNRNLQIPSVKSAPALN